MGYRNYLYSVDKKIGDELKKMELKELKNKYSKDKKYDYVCFSDLPFEELFCLGKGVDVLDVINRTSFFNDSETHDYFNDNSFECCLIDKMSFLKIIEWYIEEIKDFFNDIHNDAERCMYFIMEKCDEWNRNFACDLRENTNCISSKSWSDDYRIFELIRLYKTFDFDNKYLLWVGN